jgi:UDPglucose 6-dehydrogenase
MPNIAIGIIGYGVVGKAIHAGMNIDDVRIVDPAYTELTVEDVCTNDVAAIFVCIPTPDTDPTFNDLAVLLNKIAVTGYTGLVVVKSTALPLVLGNRPIVYNPEFLTHSTADDDFIHPPYVVIAGERAAELVDLYTNYSDMDMSNTHVVDLPTACFIKYVSNVFFALKVSFMNEMATVANSMGADFAQAGNILSTNPAMGNNHFKVPGPDGQPGFGGACLPKDLNTFLTYYHSELLAVARALNNKVRP